MSILEKCVAIGSDASIEFLLPIDKNIAAPDIAILGDNSNTERK
jgi:hypothetical protein